MESSNQAKTLQTKSVANVLSSDYWHSCLVTSLAFTSLAIRPPWKMVVI